MMCKKLTSLVIASSLVVFLCSASVAASSKEEKEARLAEKVKTGIAKLGTGPAAGVEVKLRDKTKIKGYISELSENYFIVIDDKTGAATTVAYPQVKQVKGNNLSTGAKIAIGIGVVAFLVLFAIALPDRLGWTSQGSVRRNAAQHSIFEVNA